MATVGPYTYPYYHPMHVTYVDSTSVYNYGYSNSIPEVFKGLRKESRKKLRDRLSKELMHASWSMKQQIQEKIYKVIQICKPRHMNQKR